MGNGYARMRTFRPSIFMGRCWIRGAGELDRPLNVSGAFIYFPGGYGAFVPRDRWTWDLKPEYRRLFTVVKTGRMKDGLMLYVELVLVDPFRAVRSQFIDVLEHLCRVGVIPGGNSRWYAGRLANKFSLMEVETRFDCGWPLCDAVRIWPMSMRYRGLTFPADFQWI